MRVFLLNTKMLSEINRKEEITDDTYLITDHEAELIKANLENNGYFWIDENHQLRLSGKKPNSYSYWDNESHSWKINSHELDDWITSKKAEVWEEIKKKREHLLLSGVKIVIKNEVKWFHTDLISQQSYDRAKGYLANHTDESINWKTMDNTYVKLGLEDLNALTDRIFIIGQRIFEIAESKRLKLLSLTDPELIENFNIEDGWVEVFNPAIHSA